MELSATAVIPIGQPLGGPYAVSAGDFNEDGIPDMAVGDYHGESVVILPGIGDGHFQAGTRTPLAMNVRRMAVADLDGDGHLDIVVTCVKEDQRQAVSDWSNELVVLLGRGDGSFREPARTRLPEAAWGIAAVDLDGDGVVDLAVGQQAKILLMMGTGDGTFRDPVELPTPIKGYSDSSAVIGIRSADLNLDGKPDLVAVHEISAAVSMLVSTPTGGYRGEVLAAPQGSGYAHDVAIADFDRDGKPDLAVCEEGGCFVLAGNGDGTFRPPAIFDEPARPMVAAAGDLNGDGLPDLVLGNYYAGKISVLLGNGDGTFHEMPPILAKGDTFGLEIADLNGDGVPDVLAANHSSSSVTIALGQGEGNFQPAMTLNSSTVAVTAADLDGDGKAELVAVNHVSDTANIVRGTGELAGTYFVDFDPNRAFAADLNGDGIPDLVLPGGRRGPGGSWLEYATILLGIGNGRFQRAGTITPGVVLAVADFDGDGRADLAATDSYTSIQLYRSNGDATFTPAGKTELRYGVGAVAVADLNRDGRPDLAVASSNAVLVFLNQGGGTFQAAAQYDYSQRPAAILVADFNADRIPDVAVVLPDSVCLLLGTADGPLKSGPCVSVGLRIGWELATVAGDFDGDGHTDLAIAETSVPRDDPMGPPSSVVWVLLGNGAGTFQPPLRAWSRPISRLSSIVAADFDGDGATELGAAVYSYTDFGTSVWVLSRRRSP